VSHSTIAGTGTGTHSSRKARGCGSCQAPGGARRLPMSGAARATVWLRGICVWTNPRLPTSGIRPASQASSPSHRQMTTSRRVGSRLSAGRCAMPRCVPRPPRSSPPAVPALTHKPHSTRAEECALHDCRQRARLGWTHRGRRSPRIGEAKNKTWLAPRELSQHFAALRRCCVRHAVRPASPAIDTTGCRRWASMALDAVRGSRARRRDRRVPCSRVGLAGGAGAPRSSELSLERD
jgi:hypothetical protein